MINLYKAMGGGWIVAAELTGAVKNPQKETGLKSSFAKGYTLQ